MYPKNSGKDILFANFPIPDRKITTDEKLESIAKFILKLIGKGNKVLVHCYGGKGRTGTVIGLVLGRLYYINYQTTIKLLKETFETRKDKGGKGKKSMPQTNVQFKQLKRLLISE